MKSRCIAGSRSSIVPTGPTFELSGEVRLSVQAPTNFNSVLEPTDYNQSMTVSAVLTDLRTKKTIWSTHSVAGGQSQPIVAQTVVTTTPRFLQQNLRGGDIANLTDIQTAQTQTAVARDLADAATRAKPLR